MRQDMAEVGFACPDRVLFDGAWRCRSSIYNQMVVYRQSSADRYDQLFGALADATRRDILARVMNADASVSELAARYEMSFAAVQKHVAVLERAQLVIKRKD